MNLIKKYLSPNYSISDYTPRPVKYIILHYTEMTFAGALERLCDITTKVSAHYLINKDGRIFQLVPNNFIAWHAGASFWLGDQSLNDISIGIELDNLGDEPFSLPQMNSCISLCKALILKYDILPKNVLGHSDIAPHRQVPYQKLDPGVFFDWQLLAQNGLGIIWVEPTIEKIDFPLLSTGEIRLLQASLIKIGYQLELTGTIDDATHNIIRAFQSHFNPKAIREQGGTKVYKRDFTFRFKWDNISQSILSQLMSRNS